MVQQLWALLSFKLDVNTFTACLFNRKLEKGSPEIPLNRAEKMLQAALDRSPGTPRNNARNKRSLSQSSTEISSSPESPYMKKNSQLPSEGELNPV